MGQIGAGWLQRDDIWAFWGGEQRLMGQKQSVELSQLEGVFLLSV